RVRLTTASDQRAGSRSIGATGGLSPTCETSHVRKRKVAVLGATGTVGQRFIGLLADHPWFEITALTTSDAKAGRRYGDVAPWHWPGGLPVGARERKLVPATDDLDAEICLSDLPAEAAAQRGAPL